MLAYLSFFIALAIFCIVVTIKGLFISFICFTSVSVLSVVSTLSGSNLLNSASVWESKSFLSTKKNTFLMLGSLASIWLALKDVKVFPLPVVCHINPLLLVSKARVTKLSTA